MTFDEIRATSPDMGVSAYALEPGGPVTLEFLAPTGETFTFTGATLVDAAAAAFPEQPPPTEPESLFD